jgi:hypothetical protein
LIRPVSAITRRTELQAQTLQRGAFPFKIRHGVIVENAVGFQEAVYLDSCEPEHFAELWFGYASSPELFQCEGLEGAARQVTRSIHAVDQFIRDLKGDVHEVTVTRRSNRVKKLENT